MRWLGPVFVVLAFVGVARADGGAADAAARQAARDHYRKGSVAYELGHYDTAISEYEAAYQAYSDASLLYNLGQAHRLARHSDEALHFYRMYLIKVPDAANRAEVEAKIAALQAAVAQSSPKPSPAPVATAAKPTPKPTPVQVEQPAPSPPPLVINHDREHDRGRARSMKIAGIVVDVVGLGLVGGGIGLELVSTNAANDISRADANHQPFDPSKYATYQNDRIAGGVLIGVGVAAVVTGTVLAIVGARRGRAPTAVAALRF